MRQAEAVTKTYRDPVSHDIELPLEAFHFPQGFRLKLLTNSAEVHAAAEESWGFQRLEFERPALEVRIVVRDQGCLANEPAFLSQGHIITLVADRDNFGCVDFRSLFAYAFVSRQTAADHSWFRWYFLEPLVYLLLTQTYTLPIHAACIAKNGRGLLISGASGAGKSTLAFASARAGWTFVSDDATSLLQDSDDRIAIGRPHQARVRDDAPQFFPELEGYVTRARPNGKLSIEIPMADFPAIRTALHCSIESVVCLDRRPGRPSLERISGEESGAALASEMPTYGHEVRGRHERTINRLVSLPAYRIRYQRLEDAIALLETIV